MTTHVPHISLLRAPAVSALHGSKTFDQAPFLGPANVHRVSRNNGIRWSTSWVNISSTLREEYVGLEEVDDGVWSVWFGPVLLGRFDERDLRVYGVRNLQ